MRANVAANSDPAEDIAQVQATEDREIVAVKFGVTANTNAPALSFSSVDNGLIGSTADSDTEASRSPVIAYRDSAESKAPAGNPVSLGMEWAQGEEVHLHCRNLTAAEEEVSCLIYYREI